MTDTIDRLRKIASQFPKLPGVYLMKDFDGVIIYIGKAKDLRARVRTYFAGGDGRAQIEYLIRRVSVIDKIVTNSEEEAFLLERDLINRHKPRYNIRLKDDKAYLSVRIDINSPWPRLELVRRVEQDGALYYGPYTGGFELRSLLDVIKNVIPLRTCSNTIFYNRQRPCLEYQIKRCAGPCCLPVDEERYRDWVKQACSILEGKIEPTIKHLEEQMEEASEALRFEEAAALRDRMARLRAYVDGGTRPSHYGESRDCIGIHREGELVTFSILKIRGGRISDSDSFSFQGVHITSESILESVIEQYYDRGREIPDEIILPFPLENSSIVRSTLRSRSGATVDLTVPKRGSKEKLLGLAILNARQQFSVKFESESRFEVVSQEMAKSFRLRQIPRRIECIDISNLQGSDIVGALVAWFDGSPDKKGYRKYKISFQGKPDDFKAIHEVVIRRLWKAKELPDLLIIDGGKQQLQMALKARDELALNLDIISIAKMKLDRERSKGLEVSHKPERIFVEGGEESIPLSPDSPLTHFLQRIRDDVHRFVLGYHKATRTKRLFRSALDQISGLGFERKQRLFKEFGSVKKISEASPSEIARVGRMPLSLAIKVVDILR